MTRVERTSRYRWHYSVRVGDPSGGEADRGSFGGPYFTKAGAWVGARRAILRLKTGRGWK